MKSKWKRPTLPAAQITPRDLLVLHFLFDNGPTRSLALHALFFSNGTMEICTDRLRRLWAYQEHAGKTTDGYIDKPFQQRRIEYAHCNFNIYDISPAGIQLLIDHGRISAEEARIYKNIKASRADMNFWHDVMTADEMADIRFASTARFIPKYEIVANSPAKNLKAPLRVPLTEGGLTPDELFGQEYPDRFTFFLGETDQYNMPARRKGKGSSYAAKYPKYAEFFERKLYHEHYGITLPPYVLNLTINEAHAKTCMKYVREYPILHDRMLFKAAPEFDTFERPKPPDGHIYTGEWLRFGQPPVTLGEL